MFEAVRGPLKRGLTRRRFLCLSGLFVAAGSGAACASSVDASQEEVLALDELFDPLQPPVDVSVARTGSRITASWAAGSTDDGSPRYQVMVNGEVVTTTSSTTIDLDGQPSTTVSVSVATSDGAGRLSRPSATVVIGVDEQPTGGLRLWAVPAAGAVQLRWDQISRTPQATNISRARIRRDGLPVATLGATAEGRMPSAYLATGAATDKEQEYSLELLNQAGEIVATSTNVVRAQAYRRAWPDSSFVPPRPSPPQSVVAGGNTVLSWPVGSRSTASVTRVFVDGVFVADVGAASVELATSQSRSAAVTIANIDLQTGRSSSPSDKVVAPIGARASSRAPRRFAVDGGRILSPEGRTFVPLGANISGPDFVWHERTLGTGAGAVDNWHWTTIRLSCGARDFGSVNPDQGYIFFSNNQIDQIIEEYTSRKVVVILAQHHAISPDGKDGQGVIRSDAASAPDGTGRSAVEALISWWVAVARRYRDNPYVWINPVNEPGADLERLNAQYRVIVARLRAVAPLTPIVLDAANFANDIPNDATIGDGPIKAEESFVLTHGERMVEDWGEPAGYGPVIFGVHVYSRWPRDYAGSIRISDAALANRMRAYAKAARRNGLAIVVTETGVEEWAREYDSAAVRVGLYGLETESTGVWEQEGVGVLAWHTSPVSGMALTTVRDWSRVAAVSQVAAAPAAGQALWEMGKRRGRR